MNNETESRMSHHEIHCKNCINTLKCLSHNECKIIECKLKCGFKFHECKLDEHLNETCALADMDCINKVNGCKFRFKRNDLTNHLKKCCANVVQCSSFRMRKIANKNEIFKKLKFPDPIYTEMLNLKHLNQTNETNIELKYKNINNILLEQDYKSLKDFCEQNPLKFQRMYGYLIGLKLNPNSSEYKFSFLKYLLKTVKSKVFKDIEAENCIVFNDEIGCIACQTRIKYLEMNRFDKLKKDRYHFDFILKNIDSYEQFIEKRIYLDKQFLSAYNEFFIKQSQAENEPEIMENMETNEELQEKLLKTNLDLLDSIELNSTLKLNVAKELPCEAFQLQYESYRLNDNHFAIDCNELLRRDEFADHYSLYHNFLLNNSEIIHSNCPMSDYGCNYFQCKYDFMFTNSFSDDCENHPLTGFLIHNDLCNQLTFKLDNLDKFYYEKNICNDQNEINLLDLPFDVLYEIFDKLDSLSLFSLSLTCKALRNISEQFLQLRGIIYPKWCKTEIVNEDEFREERVNNLSQNDNNNNNLNSNKNYDSNELTNNQAFIKKTSSSKWRIEKFVYSFTKHSHAPSVIKLKDTNIKRNKEKNFNQHVQNCPFKLCKNLSEPFKLFPPYTNKPSILK